jgi:gliding motility associated protien GldN
MKTLGKFFAALFLVLSMSVCSFAQENINSGYNDLSVRPIHSSDIMFKKRVWRRIDLREVQNSSFFSSGRELTRLILDAAKKGIIQPYEADTLGTPMAMESFLDNLTNPAIEGFATDDEEEAPVADPDDPFADPFADPAGSSAGSEDPFAEDAGGGDDMTIDPYYLANELFIIELQEDVIFDKKRSRMYYDVLTLKIVVDASKTPDGIDKTVAVFSFTELVEKLFKDNPEAIWFNDQNSAEHRNIQDAFDLRLFASRIIKVSNTDNKFITDIYGPGKATLYGSDWYEMKLMEYEHELWEF